MGAKDVTELAAWQRADELRQLFLSTTLVRQRVGLVPVDEGIWSLQFGAFELGRFDERAGAIG